MITRDEIEQFVESQILSGEEIFYVSSIAKPILQWKKIGIGVVVLLSTGLLANFLPEDKVAWGREERLLVLGSLTAFLVVLFLLWSLVFYKKSTRRIVVITGLRFIIFEYSGDLHSLKVENLSDFEFRKEIPFENVEMLKLTPDKDNSGVLALLFEQENKEKNGYVQAKLHLEIEDCQAMRKAVPARLRPEGSKEDYWERTYRD